MAITAITGIRGVVLELEVRVQNIVKVCDGRSVILLFFMHDVNTGF